MAASLLALLYRPSGERILGKAMEVPFRLLTTGSRAARSTPSTWGISWRLERGKAP
jgi:hypothetical protein